MTVNIRDDRPGRDKETMIGREATPDAVLAQVWGPLRFSPGLGPRWAKADETGRSSAVTRPLDVGEGLSFQLERTPAPTWYPHHGSRDEHWRHDTGTVLRLSIVAYANETGSTWTVPIEVDLAAAGLEGFS
jgi:hypothetical protein